MMVDGKWGKNWNSGGSHGHKRAMLKMYSTYPPMREGSKE